MTAPGLTSLGTSSVLSVERDHRKSEFEDSQRDHNEDKSDSPRRAVKHQANQRASGGTTTAQQATATTSD
jgi:hypothetical protein